MALEDNKLNEEKKLKSPLGNENNDPIKELNSKVDNIMNLLYFREKIDRLEEKINDQNELLQDIKDMLKDFMEKSKEKEEKAELARITKPIMDESEDDIKIEPLPKINKVISEEPAQTPTIEPVTETLEEVPVQKEEQESLEETEENGEDWIKVVGRGLVDDLILSNAITYINSKGDKLVINGINEEEDKKEEEEKSELEREEERLEQQQNVDFSRNDISEVIEEETPVAEETPVIEGAQDINPQEEPKLSDVVEEELAQKIESSVKYVYENIKAVKSFVGRVKTIIPKLTSSDEVDMTSMPDNMRESWNENLIVMPEVLGQQSSRSM